MPSADLPFPNPSSRSHIRSRASLLLPRPTSSPISVNSFPPHARNLSHDCRFRRRSLSIGLTRNRLRLPSCPNPPRTIHRVRLARQKRSHHTRRASQCPIVDSSNSNLNRNNHKAMNRTDMVPRWPVILTWMCPALCLPRCHHRPTHTTTSNNR